MPYEEVTTVHHDAVYETVHHEAKTHTIERCSECGMLKKDADADDNSTVSD